MDAPNDTGQDVRQKEKETFAAYIQIVGPVFYNRQFSDKAKLLYGLLAAMTQAPRYYAFARNSTLMKFLCCSERTLQRCLSELEDAGELTIENGSGGRTIRKIRLTRLQPIYPDKNDGVNPDKNDGVNPDKMTGVIRITEKRINRGAKPRLCLRMMLSSGLMPGWSSWI